MGSSVYGDLLSGQAIYMIVYQDDSPSEIFAVVILEIDRECLRWGDHAHMATCQGLL